MTTTADDVWRLLAELIESQKETERKFQETERLLKEQTQETERLLKEQTQETERLLKEQSSKTDQQIQQVNQQLGKLGNRLGEFAEWQIRPAAVRLFQERGIDVHEIHSGVSKQTDEDGIEIDLLVVNETEAVLIEVKSKLSQLDVDEHLDRLGKFKQLMPRYGNVRTLGAVAGMVVPVDIARYAYRQGLFVIAPSGDDVIILNDLKFQPKIW
jgi:hypothetical protein